jgi:hypothetical protein
VRELGEAYVIREPDRATVALGPRNARLPLPSLAKVLPRSEVSDRPAGGQSLTRTRVHAPAAVSPSDASGEALHTLPEEEAWPLITGDGGVPVAPAPVAGSGTGAGAATVPRLQKTSVSAATTVKNGGFSWPVRWSLQNATASTHGWIVQLVSVGHSVSDSSGAAVTPGTGSYGGLRHSWYPLWEAWQVRRGQVFVGGSTSPHNADTYSQGRVGASTRGATAVLGWANFYPNLTIPSAFTVRNAAPAWALPVTNSNPGLTGGTGELKHNLIASWNGVTADGTTTVTTQ